MVGCGLPLTQSQAYCGYTNGTRGTELFMFRISISLQQSLRRVAND